MKVIITGGAGFIGCNAARRYMSRGDDVVVVDDLSRRGADKNLRWLETQGGFTFERVDIRQAEPTRRVFEAHRDAGLVLHLAGQVAVTLSVRDPRDDFEVNALGTFNVLEGARNADIRAPMVYSSTNKVYGGMEDVGVVLRDGRYAYDDLPRGVSEERPLDFHSPYGCSKGAADQYWRDYQRIYGLRTVVFRQSCIYGYRQFGFEDQGWVAWFTIAAQLGRDITVYGDGRQVRDILFVDDLVDGFDCAARHIGRTEGQCYNMGGGPENVISLLDLLAYLEERIGRKIPLRFDDWRPGDQRVFVADVSRASREMDWRPRTGWRQGLEKLYDWVAANKGLFE
ncbi:MAG TPA: NAD-dependent epimerase/dehydratase family protein [Gemmatimonadaceae bacterium]|nr:NAD-dependent epimerase/dehydratase family protein [Gemmatimonadaceae bacterium]